MPRFTPDELQRYRSERPWNNDLPDELVTKLLDFHVAVLHYRVRDLGRSIRDSLPSWVRRWLDA